MNPFQFRDDPSKELKKKLFRDVNGGEWKEVIKTYEENPSAHTEQIISSGDTALHVAVSNGEESAVENLVAVVCQKADTGRAALEMKNELGNTPLHLAAYLGNANICRWIAERDSTLMGIRNNDGETPFFVAVRQGRKEAFHALHALCAGEEGYHYCRGKDGETILHSAISGEYFDLAFDIMNHYKMLQNAVNSQGFTPLHILASKPSAFRSGSHIRGLDKLIYHCIFVDELQLNTLHNNQVEDLEYKEEAAIYPRNYHACVGMFTLLQHIVLALLGYSSQKNDEESNRNEKHDEEKNTKDHQQKKEHSGLMVLCERTDGDAERLQSKKAKKDIARGSTKRMAQGHQFFPANYITFYNFIKLISKAMLVILGLGSESVEKMREKKAKHIWSFQIMVKLLDDASVYEYEYEYNGKSPGDFVPGKESETANSYTLPSTAGAVDYNQNTFETIVRENPDQQSQNPTQSKSDSSNLPCGKCGEVLCALLDSMGLLKEVFPEGRGDAALDMEKKEKPILIAAKNGVLEMVEGILKRFPMAALDTNNEEKNIVLLAVEHRQRDVYKFLTEWETPMRETIFKKTDKDGNSVKHLAARIGNQRPWLIPVLQMQWEIKWYEYVKKSKPPHFFQKRNHKSERARDIFTKAHTDLVQESSKWLANTSESCSLVAALIVTVAFPTFATIPGGVKSDDSGIPSLHTRPVFSLFAISSLVAFSFSVTAVVMFLALLTSKFQERDFRTDLPKKLVIGLTSLFISIASMLVSFCAGHFFMLEEKVHYVGFLVYAITCLPILYFAIPQFPFYFDLVRATKNRVPQSSSKYSKTSAY